MHHLYPLGKGDPLCPLGFHPQVRWPTRCKRCFRDYKEHGGKKREEDSLRRDDSTASTPSLNSWGSSRLDDNRRSWASSSNLAPEKEKRSGGADDFQSPASWTSTPDLANLEDDTQANIPTVSLTLPKRKQLPIDRAHRTVSDSVSVMSRSDKSAVFGRSDDLATRAKKLQAIKETTHEKSEKKRRIQIKEVVSTGDGSSSNNDVKTKSSKDDSQMEDDDDSVSTTGTETTDTTLVGDRHDNELQEQIESLKQELEATKAKCDRLEREKSDLLLRRLAAMETTTSKTTATEVLKLQQKCNELQGQLEDLKDDKKSLGFKVRELEEELENRPTAQAAQKAVDEIRSKLLAAETLCEELMDENEDMKKELRDLEEEMEEMQDNFREDQADEYSSIKKELEQTTKNCRILSFKLRKSERKVEQLESDRAATEKKLQEVSNGLNNLEKIKVLEQELKVSNEVAVRLQKELEEVNSKLSKVEENTTKKKAPKLGNIPKFPSSEGKVSRESLTRGGSQEDPAVLLRDLQDSLEREADLREQLKFAEEEAQNLRKKVLRIEDDNESLVLQLKKMATKAKSRKLSPNSRLTPEPSIEKDEGISDDEDPAELRLLLELNEQETKILRKKVEELEAETEVSNKKIKELQEKLTSKTNRKSVMGSVKTQSANALQDQKVKVLEEEISDLRKKLIEKEREAERLHIELSLSQKRSRGMQKSKSLDIDQQTLDLKRQLEVIEQEAAVLRSKVQSLETENEKLASENKRLQLLRGTKTSKSDKTLDKYIDKIAELEIELSEANNKIKTMGSSSGTKSFDNGEALRQKLMKMEDENDKLSETLKRLKEEAAKSFKNRIPKKPADVNSKIQLRNMVNDLENEIGELMVVLKNSENAKLALEGEINQLKSNKNSSELDSALKELEGLQVKLLSVEKELADEKSKFSKEKSKYDELNSNFKSSKEALKKVTDEKKSLRAEKQQAEDEAQRLQEEKASLLEKINKLSSDIENHKAKEKDYQEIQKKLEKAEDQLKDKETEITKLRKEMEEKIRANKEYATKTKKITEIEKQLLKLEEEAKKKEKHMKDLLRDMESKLSKEETKSKEQQNEFNSTISKLTDEKKTLSSKIDELDDKIKSLEAAIESKDKAVEQLEEHLRKEREKSSQEISRTKAADIAELEKTKSSLVELQTKLDATIKNKTVAEEKLKKLENDFGKEKLELERKVKELDIDLQNERKKVEIIKTNQEKEQKNREIELNSLKNKIKSLELNSNSGNKKITEVKQEYQGRIDKLETAITSAKKDYDELTAKYEILEEEHVVTKAKLVMEKESLSNQLTSTKSELEGIEKELQTLRETYNTKQDTWIKEKLTLQEKLKELEKKSRGGGGGGNLEKTRLKASLEEKQSELDQIKREYEVINDQLEYMRRENDELKKKLDDYDKVAKIQRNISADSSALEKEMKQLRIRLSNTEKSRKSDLAECKMRYESQINVINEELKSLQVQVTRFKRERDTFKHMLESAQKAIGDLKSTPASRRDSRASIASLDELEESRTKIATLEQQISCMEDELSEARLEASKLKTELVSERSSWEVKLSELHSRVNELEEERLLSSGRTKIPGLKTKMELAWQKEREEQQRLLQETSTLARDLRQTLFEVERERDKERLEAKRKQDQLKKTMEEDQEENRRKITELQCDLLELRDAHAKLRTTNEKLRREKERYEREREEMKSVISSRKRSDQDEERKITALIDQVETLIRLTPELRASRERTVDMDSTYTPTPPRRNKSSKSRETSPALDRSSKESSVTKEDRASQIHSVMQRLCDVTEALKMYQRHTEEERDRERIKRSMGMRRATSTEHDDIPNVKMRQSRNGSTGGTLHRKSISLEHAIQQEQNIWRMDDGSLSSMQSLEDASDIETGKWKRDSSLDSRLSGGSTQSETGEKKKKKGLMGKLKKLAKSRSIDDQDPGHFPPPGTLSSKPSSNSEVNEEKGSKKDLRGRLTGMFKRGGSSSRSNSLERQGKHDTSSTQRPLMPNGSNSSISKASGTVTR